MRPIDADWVVSELLKERDNYPPAVPERYSLGVAVPNAFNSAIRGGIRKGLRAVETAPTLDVVPVIRCKDCKSFAEYTDKFKTVTGHDGACLKYVSCDEPLGYRNFTDFCSLARRKDDP